MPSVSTLSPAPRSPSPRTDSLYTLLVFLSLVLVLVVVILSAYLRLAGSGLGCAEWPACYALIKSTAGGTESLASAHLVPAWATVIHRLAASTLGAMVVGITLMALRRRRLPGHNTGLSLAVLGLTVFLSVLGYKTPSPLLPWVTLSNLLGGMAMLAMLWWLGQRSVSAVGGDARAPSLRPWARAGVFIVFFQIALGGWVSANFAALACTGLPGCGDFPWLDGPWRESLNLFRVLSITDGGVIITGDVAKLIHMIHRLGAVVAFLYIGWLGWRGLRLGDRYRGTATSMLVLLLLQILLGVAAVVSSLPLTMVAAHNALAALLLLSTVNLMHLLTPATEK
ncbi:MAG: COX15/CtaA family protein [Sulfuricaulis sp.]|uniref:COX15/CtaA family protein n=1 Tax=Sulfuricaulis sp. TaxID=2003553 RepID=UPI003C420571